MQTTVITRSFLVFLLSCFTIILSPTPTVAEVHPAPSYAFTVNTTHDTHDAHPGDGVCAHKKGQCSLRAAIEEADALPSGSQITIMVPAGTYRLSLGTLGLTANTITITGASRTTTIIDGHKQFTVLAISPSVAVSLSRLSIANGYGNSGGIYNRGTLSVSASTFSDNSTTFDSSGGGISNDGGTLSVNTSTFSGNSASEGGGIESFYGTLNVSNSTFSHNSAISPAGDGGGIENYVGTLTVNNSTFSDNSAQGEGGYGGAIRNIGGMLKVNTSTFNGNQAWWMDAIFSPVVAAA